MKRGVWGFFKLKLSKSWLIANSAIDMAEMLTVADPHAGRGFYHPGLEIFSSAVVQL